MSVTEIIIDQSNPLRPRNKHETKQDYQTPPDFLEAVRKRFGALRWDLAANESNSVVKSAYLWKGYFDESDDSLQRCWHGIGDGFLWLNPPFNRCAELAAKCHEESLQGAKILFLTPASVDSNWYADHVQPFAHSLWLASRIKFIGAAGGYPKPLMLSVYAYGLTGKSRWEWKRKPIS